MKNDSAIRAKHFEQIETLELEISEMLDQADPRDALTVSCALVVRYLIDLPLQHTRGLAAVMDTFFAMIEEVANQKLKQCKERRK